MVMLKCLVTVNKREMFCDVLLNDRVTKRDVKLAVIDELFRVDYNKVPHDTLFERVAYDAGSYFAKYKSGHVLVPAGATREDVLVAIFDDFVDAISYDEREACSLRSANYF